MTEIEQLRADIATLEAAEAVFARKYGQTYQRYNIELDMIRKQLARLEKEAEDPWREARDSVNVYVVSNHSSIQLLAKYARHLEAQVVELEEEVRCERIDGGKVHADLRNRIAELEAELLVSQNELAKRPSVWCVLREGGYMRRRCGCVKTFRDRDKQSSSITKTAFRPYTGEQE